MPKKRTALVRHSQGRGTCARAARASTDAAPASHTLQGARSAPCGGHLNIAHQLCGRVSGEQRGAAALLCGRGELVERLAGSLVADPSRLMGLGWQPALAAREGLARLARESASGA